MNFKIKEVLLTALCFLPISIIIGKAALNINLIIFDLIVLLYIFKKKDQINFKLNQQSLLIIFLIIFLILNLFFSDNLDLSIHGFLGLIKNIIFFVGLIFFIKYEDLKKFFSFTIILCMVFVALNIYLQYLTGEDLFGNKIVGQNRSTAVFGNQIPGSYVVKFFFLGLLFSFFNKKILFNLIYISFFTSAIILTNERMPLINIVMFSIVFLLLIPKINIYKKTLCLFFYFSIIFSTYNLPTHNNIQLENSEKIYEKIISRTKTQYEEQTKDGNIFDIYWFQHFRAANDLFKENLIIGSGIKTYRYSCPLTQLKKDKSLQLLCNIHPHNLYFEIISETGILGLFFICFLLIKLIIGFFSLYFNHKENRHELFLVFLPVFMLFNPVQFTGSFFSTFSGFFYFLVLAIAFKYIRIYSITK